MDNNFKISKKTKIVSLESAITDNIKPGNIVFLGGFGHAIPFYSSHEIIRQNIKDLTICRSGADILFDQMIASGIVSKVIFGYIGNPGVGLSHSFRKAVKDHKILLEEWTNYSLILRLHAGRMGLPFIPSKILQIGDMPDNIKYMKTIKCPYTDINMSAIPALVPDVAVIHAQQADEFGNIQMWGVDGDTIEGALASNKIIVSVERIVDNSEIKKFPDRTVIPAHRVSAVVELPWGAYPSYVTDFYSRDDKHYIEYDKISRDPDLLNGYIDKWIRNIESIEEYKKLIGMKKLKELQNGICGLKSNDE